MVPQTGIYAGRVLKARNRPTCRWHAGNPPTGSMATEIKYDGVYVSARTALALQPYRQRPDPPVPADSRGFGPPARTPASTAAVCYERRQAELRPHRYRPAALGRPPLGRGLNLDLVRRWRRCRDQQARQLRCCTDAVVLAGSSSTATARPSLRNYSANLGRCDRPS
jgi:hypothetical protein